MTDRCVRCGADAPSRTLYPPLEWVERLRTERGLAVVGVLAVPLRRTRHDRVAPLREAYRSLDRLPAERRSIVRDRVETLLADLDLAAVIDERPSRSLAALRELDGTE